MAAPGIWAGEAGSGEVGIFFWKKMVAAALKFLKILYPPDLLMRSTVLA